MPHTSYDYIPEKIEYHKCNPLEWKVGDIVFGFFRIFCKFEGGSCYVYGLEHKDVVNRDTNGNIILDGSSLLGSQRPILAAKVPRREVVLDPEASSRFAHECKVWAHLGHHPHIVQAYAVRYIGNLPVLLMEFIHKGTLKDVIEAKDSYPVADLNTILTWVLDFCQAMKVALKKGLIFHGDITPSNLLIDLHNRLKLSDFGLAWMKDFIHNYKIHGTPGYRSPEHELGGNLDIRSDIYSFGIVLNELLTGNRISSSEKYILLKSRLGGDHIRKSLENILSKCVAQSPENRYQHIQNLESDLLNVLEKNLGGNYEIMLERSTFEKVTGEVRMMVYAGFPTEALDILKFSDLYHSNIPDVCKLKGECFFEMGKYEEALDHFIMYQKELDCRVGGDKGFPLWFVTPSTRADAFYSIALCLARLERYDEAIKNCDRAISYVPKFAPAWKVRCACLVDILYLKSEDSRSDLLIRDAIKSANMALNLSPESVETMVNKGIAQMLLEEFEQAKRSAEHALELDPNYPPAWQLFGDSSRHLGDFDNALKGYDKAAHLAPTSDMRHNSLFEKARLLLAIGDPDEIEQICIQVEREGGMGPNFDYIKGVLLIKKGKPADALKLLLRAISSFPNESMLLANIGNAYQMLGKSTKAQEYYMKSLELNPDSVEALNGKLALILTKWDDIGRPVASEIKSTYKEFIRLIKLAPTISIAHRNFAIFYRMILDYKEALKEIIEAIRLDPYDMDAKDLKDQFENERYLFSRD